MAQTLEKLRAENPELANALMAEAQAAAGQDKLDVSEAVKAEQRRIAEIDEISAIYDDETVKAAKYGDNACTAREMAFRAARAAVKKGAKALGDLESDTKASGAMGVGASPAPADDGKDSPDAVKAAAKGAAAMYTEMMGGTKK